MPQTLRDCVTGSFNNRNKLDTGAHESEDFMEVELEANDSHEELLEDQQHHSEPETKGVATSVQDAEGIGSCLNRKELHPVLSGNYLLIFSYILVHTFNFRFTMER